MKKHIIYLLTISLFVVSCKEKVTDFSQLQDRNGLFFLMNTDKPFSGKVVAKSNGILEFEGSFKDGLRTGNWVYYYPNGQKQTEGVFVDGAKDGQWPIWKENGVLDYYEIYKYGNLISDNKEKEEETEEEVKEEEKKKEESDGPKMQWVNWNQLQGGSTKTYNGVLYTGGFTQYYSNGAKSLIGYYTNGVRSGKWTFYHKNGTVKDVKHY